MAKKTIDDISVWGNRVLMRVDFNVPLANGKISDNRRIREALPSIRSVRDRGGRLILISHLGRPTSNGPQPKLSLKPCASHLAQLLGSAVSFADDCVGPIAAQAAAELGNGDVLLLENLRFHRSEKDGDRVFAANLASLADIYCNNAFSNCHRQDASMVAAVHAMSGKPKVIGSLVEKEIRYLSDAIQNPSPPFIPILGGAKVSDKISIIKNLVGKVDKIIIGGAMAYTFLKAQGRSIGVSPCHNNFLDQAAQLLTSSAHKLLLPTDLHCSDSFNSRCQTQIVEGDIPDGWQGMDIGPKSLDRFTGAVANAKTIVWNGPMGVFEMPPFDTGTRGLAEAITHITTEHGCTSIIGGGDSAAAIEQFGLSDHVTHVSTGGGASLAMLSGKKFTSVELLDEI